MRKLLLPISFILSFHAFASHIVGGEMYYDCLGNNVYRIHLKVYRDCFATGPNVANFDDPAQIAVYDAQGTVIDSLSIALTNRVSVPPNPSNPCYQAPSNICVEEGDYDFDVTLPANTGGYDVVYTRCCRNASVVNIVNPNQVGATYTVHINPQTPVCNNSPRFTLFPPIVICAGVPLVFDHSATDPDGDSLVYSFCDPYIGGDPTTPAPFPSPPPFSTVTWAAPYSPTNLLGGTPPMTIDPHTGIINANPNFQGRFVVGVCCQEFRNGVLIGTIKRDFQFNVTQCLQNVHAVIPIVDTVGAGSTHTTGIFIYGCDSLKANFVNNSINATTYHWDFGVNGINSDTSNLFQPSYTYPDTGIYVVSLIANPGYFCADTTKVYVRIFPGFKTNYNFISACENQALAFTDSSITQYGFVNSWTWNFGDSTTNTTQNPTHRFNDGGSYPVKLISTTSKGCKDSITKAVTVYPIAKGGIITDPPCLGQPFNLSTNATIKSGSITGYNWTFGNGNHATTNPANTSFSTLGNDTIILIMTTDLGCKDTLQKAITIVPLPTIRTNNDTAVCINQPVQLLATGALTYNWLPVNGLSNAAIANPVALPADTTHYIVIGTDSQGCKGRDTVNINIWPLPLTNAGRDTFVCFGSSYQLNATGGNTFEWTPSKYLSDTAIANPISIPDSAITYFLTSKSIYGCINHDTINLTVEFPIKKSLTGKHVICRNDTTILTASGGLYYLWKPTSGLSSANIANPIASPDSNTTYQVVLANDCFTDSLPWAIRVNQLPPVKATGTDTINRDDTTTVYVSGAETYLWKPSGLFDSTSTSLLVSPFNTTNYMVTGTDTNGCKNIDSVMVFVNVVNLVLLPSGFSPNADGVNDVFHIIKHLNIQQLYEFSVFNRWGEKVFSTDDIKAGWDGTYRGENAPLGAYVYLVKALNRDGKTLTLKGNITLIR